MVSKGLLTKEALILLGASRFGMVDRRQTIKMVSESILGPAYPNLKVGENERS
jgi:hypothetical protein